MRHLTTHVLDTAAGLPAAGMAFRLSRLDGAERALLVSGVTNQDGRCDSPLLEGEEFLPGSYELSFGVADYFRARGVALSDPPFLDRVSLCFGVDGGDRHYHVPLLVSPWAYSTYRGS